MERRRQSECWFTIPLSVCQGGCTAQFSGSSKNSYFIAFADDDVIIIINFFFLIRVTYISNVTFNINVFNIILVSVLEVKCMSSRAFQTL